MHIELIFISLLAVATEQPVCNSEAVTRNCDFFRERRNQNQIELPNGAHYSNPMFVIPTVNPAATPSPTTTTPTMIPATASTYGNLGGDAFLDQMIVDESEVIDLFQNTRVVTSAQLTVARFLQVLSGNPSGTTRIMWPLDGGSNAQMQNIRNDQILAEVRRKIGPQKSRDLERIITRRQALATNSIGGMGIGLPSNPPLVLNSTVDAGALVDTERAARKAHIQRLFEYSKTQVANTILRGRSESELSDEEKILLYRVRRTTLADLDNLDAENSPNCRNGAKNAYNTTELGVVTLCPGHFSSADGALVRVFSHEIGHGIDPCRSQMPAYRIDQQKLTTFLGTHNLNASDRGILQRIQRSGATEYIKDLNIDFNSSTLAQELISAGVFTRFQEGMTPARYPFAPQYSCLSNRAGFRELTSADSQEVLSLFRSGAAKDGGVFTATDRANLRRAEQTFQRYPQCFSSIRGGSQMNEVMADVFGSVALEKYLYENPGTEESRVGSVTYAIDSCNGAPATAASETPPPEISPGTIFSSPIIDLLRDEHPLNSARVSGVILNLPYTAQLFNCRRAGPRCFDDLSLVSGRRANSSRATPQPARNSQ